MSEPGADVPLGEVIPGTVAVAASPASARRILTRDDPFTENQTPFDRQARMYVPASEYEATREIYFRYLMTQARAWTDQEVGALKAIIGAVRDRFATLDIALPATITLIKTTGQEEGFAAYTRGSDAIVLPETKIASLLAGGEGGDALHPEPSLAALQDIVIHEFFHLISKNNEERRRRLYALVGYVQFDRAIELPDCPWSDGVMRDLKITNPDTPELNVKIDLVPPGGAEEVPMLPVLLADRRYAGGVFFDYLQWWFLALEPDGDGWRLKTGADGVPVHHAAGDMREQYLDKVGRTVLNEIFHPDEVLAQDFVLSMNEPDRGLLARIRDALGSGGA